MNPQFVGIKVDIKVGNLIEGKIHTRKSKNEKT